MPIGFCWYAKVGDDYMNYRLDAEERLGETSVLVIRREGRYTMWLPEVEKGTGAFCATHRAPTAGWSGRSGKLDLSPFPSNGGEKTIPVVTEPQGVTLFAWNRGAVLEDRLIDRVVDAGGRFASRIGTTSQIVTRLIRSRRKRVSRNRPPLQKGVSRSVEFEGFNCDW